MTGTFVAVAVAALGIIFGNTLGFVSNKDFYLFMAVLFLVALPCLLLLTGDYINIIIDLALGSFYAIMWWRHRNDDDENNRRKRKKLAAWVKSKPRVFAPQPKPVPSKS